MSSPFPTDTDTGRWRRIKELLDQAYFLDTAARKELLDTECGRDQALREEVESLLESAANARDIFEDSPFNSKQPLQTSLIGRQIGSHRLIRRIGAGGMGAVYLAERDDGEFKQNIAVKLIEHPLLSNESARRFRRERQALANLNHPNIAKLIDGGVTEDGLPYLMMEYVDGVPINQYCDQNRLNVHQRLELFLTVCEAVKSAHGNLIIHCDLKPGNILVTRDGTVKLLDFGIARILQRDEQGGGKPFSVLATNRVMTPGYASPEQVLDQPLSTATDVYSLGVILFELLSGQRPYRVTGSSPIEWERAICREEPLKASTAVRQTTTVDDRPDDAPTTTAAQIAHNRNTLPEKLERKLAGDIDNILRVALQKEPRRRYPSVEQFADDIRRHLEGRPVNARDATITYRLAKFVRRNTVAVSAAAVMAMILISAAILLATNARSERRANLLAQQQSLRAQEAAERAQSEARKANRANEFLISMLRTADPTIAANPDITVREVLDIAAERIKEQDIPEPLVDASILFAIGQSYQSLGLYEQALTHLNSALAIRQANLPEGDADIAAVGTSLATLYYQMGKFAAAEMCLRSLLAGAREEHESAAQATARYLNDLGAVLRSVGRLDEAQTMFEEALRQRVADTDSQLDEAESMNNLGGVFVARREYDQAIPLLRQVLRIRTQERGENNLITAQAQHNLAVVLAFQNQLDEAGELLTQALFTYRKHYPEEHPTIQKTIGTLANFCAQRKDYAQAAHILHNAVAIQRSHLGADYPGLSTMLWNLASIHVHTADHQSALPLLQECLRIRRRVVGMESNDDTIATVTYEIGRQFAYLRRYDEAATFLDEGVRRLTATRGTHHTRTQEAVRWQTAVHNKLQQSDDETGQPFH